jgi:hypothetical protein
MRPRPTTKCVAMARAAYVDIDKRSLSRVRRLIRVKRVGLTARWSLRVFPYEQTSAASVGAPKDATTGRSLIHELRP